MNIDNLNNYVSQDTIDLFHRIINDYGLFAAIIIPMTESFFPVFPLFVLVAINIFIFGAFYGFLFSWIGNCLGSFLIFLIVRYIHKNRFNKPARDNLYNKIKNSIRKNDFTFLFLLFSFPFTPSFLVSGIAAASEIQLAHFLTALIPGKFFMILILSVIGYNINSFFENPYKSTAIILSILVLTFTGRKVLRYIESKHDHE